MTSNWKSILLGALHRNRSDRSSHFLQLATVDDLGRPHNRTVVFRGFCPESDRLQIATDRRSEKLTHICANPHAAICWYFTKTREQFRLTGTIAAIASESSPTTESSSAPQSQGAPKNGQQLRAAAWDAISDSGKLLWYWPQPKAPRLATDSYLDRPPQIASPPDTFVLLLFTPTEVDRLQLRGNPHDRHIFRRSSTGWTAEAVNP